MKKVVLSIFSISSLMTFGQKNLISNGSFEYDAQSWNNEIVLTIDPYNKRIGSKGGNITEYTSPQWKGIDQGFSIPKNTAAIEISAWVKTEGVEKGKNDWNKAVIIVEINGKGENIISLDGNSPWQQIKKIIPINKDRSGKLMLALSECTGSFLFDDIRITPISQEDYNKIVEAETRKNEVKIITDNSPVEKILFSNGDFENGLQGWKGNGETTTKEKFSGQKSIKIASQTSTWTGVDQIFDIPDNSKTLDISAMVKTKDVKQGKNDWNKAVMIVEFTTNGTQKTSQDEPVFFVTEAKDWQKFSKNLPIPDHSKKMRIMLALSDATGTMYVDDIKLNFNN
ncbi:carbohydrate binding domain-containing protein [Epilithonimonas sp.]|uniref:carbohydrate binding domain-containing protein n=1 Tax=Epilithonimonas sp. TaxID=2894511 RepID=UPI0028999449|nr:carbohydrate binding domain-containing protein [Epilithonimonas sp.]